MLGFEAAEILTGLKGPPNDTRAGQHATSDSSDSDDDCIPISQLGSNYFRERLPIQGLQKKLPSKKKSAQRSAPRSQTVEKGPGPVSRRARPPVQEGAKGGKKKTKKLMTREELKVDEALDGWVPLLPEDEPPFEPPVFTDPLPGPVRSQELSGDFTELDAFRLFFTDEMLDLIVQQTNKYARQRGADLRTRGHRGVWKDLGKEELLGFIGILLWTGMAKLPALEDYWNRFPDIFSGLQIPMYMARDRFREIVSFLHCADNNVERPGRGQPGHDPLWKISELLELFRTRCKKNFNPP